MLCGFQDSAPSDLSLHAIPWLLRGNSIAGCRSRIEVYERLPSGALCCARSCAWRAGEISLFSHPLLALHAAQTKFPRSTALLCGQW